MKMFTIHTLAQNTLKQFIGSAIMVGLPGLLITLLFVFTMRTIRRAEAKGGSRTLSRWTFRFSVLSLIAWAYHVIFLLVLPRPKTLADFIGGLIFSGAMMALTTLRVYPEILFGF